MTPYSMLLNHQRMGVLLSLMISLILPLFSARNLPSRNDKETLSHSGTMRRYIPLPIHIDIEFHEDRKLQDKLTEMQIMRDKNSDESLSNLFKKFKRVDLKYQSYLPDIFWAPRGKKLFREDESDIPDYFFYDS